MAPSPRGKQADQTGTWSESKWDEGRQLWYNDRIGPSGEIEYHYHQDLTTINDPSIPRGGAGFGTQNTSASTPYQDPSTYSSSAAGGAAYPPVADSYTTSSSGASWYGSNPPYSSAYGAQISSIDNEASSSLEYAGNTGSSSQPTQYGSQYGSGSTDTRMAQFSSGAVFDSYPSVESGKQGVQDLASAFSGMKLNPITEGESPYQLPVPKPIFREPGSNNYETLDPRYRQIPEKEQNNFFRVGRVFMMLWTEPARPQVPAGGGTLPNGSHISTTWLGQKAYSEIRRLVVMQQGYGNSICSPIQTYSGQGTLKPNLPDQQQHAIIYTSKYPPAENSYKAYDGTIVRENLSKDPIKVRSEQKGPEGALHPRSRINYSKIYTVENYVRVLNIGMVDRDSLPSLERNSLIQRNSPAERPTERPRKDPPSRSGTSSSGHHSSKGKGKDKRR